MRPRDKATTARGFPSSSACPINSACCRVRVLCQPDLSSRACRPRPPKPPSGELWLHEIKHDGFRVIARKDGARVKLDSRPGNDPTDRFPLIVEALARLRSRSCIIDGEAVACDENGLAVFERLRHKHDEDSARSMEDCGAHIGSVSDPF